VNTTVRSRLRTQFRAFAEEENAITPGEKTLSQRVIDAVKKGNSFMFIHIFVVSVPTLLLSYITIGTAIDFNHILDLVGVPRTRIVAEGGRWLAAFAIYKTLLPVRLSLSLFLTSFLHKTSAFGPLLRRIDNLRLPFSFVNLRNQFPKDKY